MMGARAAIYVIRHETEAMPHVHLALADLLESADPVIVVTGRREHARIAAALSGIETLARLRLVAADRDGSVLSAYRTGLATLRARGHDGAVILTGSHVFGPIRPGGWRDLASGAALFAPYWHNTTLDIRLRGRKDMPAHLPSLDFALLSPELVADRNFARLWDSFPAFTDYWDEVENGLVPLARFLARAGHRVAYALPPDAMQTAEPRYEEVDRLVALGAPCLPVSVLTLDPLLHDLNGIDLRKALDGLRGSHPALYAAVIGFATRRVQMRHFNTIADQYEVLNPHYPSTRTEWSFGRVAVFIHAFYADMMPEFWSQIEKFPMPAHLFLTTATPENKARIEAFLDARGWPAAHRTVRVVAQNRGRDMSSLFITFRDVALSGEYELALRLHSKRTPQVTRQVAEGFKAHLFDNLVPSPGAIRQLLDLFEAQPDIGMAIPPVIHVGFGTLGHSWFTNRAAVAALARRMALRVPLDDHTPVAPYGTMFWFRTDALHKMFAWDWTWEGYNPEPNHIDGGLAHVQERLIGYVAQDRGYRVISVMSPERVARDYARLEYKLQLFASRLASNHVLDQIAQLDHGAETLNARADRRLRVTYGHIITRFPGARAVLKPMARLVAMLLNPRYGRR